MKALVLKSEQSRCLFLVYPLMFLSLLNPRKKFHLTKQLQNIKNARVKVQDKKALLLGDMNIIFNIFWIKATYFFILKYLFILSGCPAELLLKCFHL